MEAGTNHLWEGAWGKTYRYWIHPLDARFRKIAGNFIFARQTEKGAWEAVFVGEIRNFDEPLVQPSEWACVQQAGATHLHAHFSSPSWERRQAERDDLIARWKPACNDAPL